VKAGVQDAMETWTPSFVVMTNSASKSFGLT
jgi:hypothetical protein